MNDKTDIISGGVVELNGRRYSVNQFNRTLSIANITRRWSGGGVITVYRSLNRFGPTFKAVSVAYWAGKETS